MDVVCCTAGDWGGARLAGKKPRRRLLPLPLLLLEVTALPPSICGCGAGATGGLGDAAGLLIGMLVDWEEGWDKETGEEDESAEVGGCCLTVAGACGEGTVVEELGGVAEVLLTCSTEYGLLLNGRLLLGEGAEDGCAVKVCDGCVTGILWCGSVSKSCSWVSESAAGLLGLEPAAVALFSLESS